MSTDDNEPLIGATIIVNPEDSSNMYRGRSSISDVNGKFKFRTSESNIQKISIEYIGYATQEITPSQKITNNQLDLGTITLKPKAQNIGQVVIKSDAVMSQIKGDTIQYNAAAFKVNPDATTEDLLKKMPSMKIESDGSITNQGQSVYKIYVNGKDFFDDDPAMALKNIPADAVESIMTYDEQSESAKFSGYDDGTRVRSINIKTKKSFENSVFGKAYAGYGTNDRYAAGLGLNIFNDKHRLSIIGSANNVNNQGFTLMDMMSSQRGNRGELRIPSLFGRGMNNNTADLSNFRTSTHGGIRNSSWIGVNYNGELGSKVKLSGGYFFYRHQTDNWSASEKIYMNMPRTSYDSTQLYGIDYSHNLRLKLEWSPTKQDIITFLPRVRFSGNSGHSTVLNEVSMEEVLTNSLNNKYNNDITNIDARFELWWTHKMQKPGRTFTVGTGIRGNNASGNRYQLSTFGLNNLDTTQNMIGHIRSSSIDYAASFSFNEPLSKSSRLSVNYQINHNISQTDQNGWQWDKLMQDFALLDTATTNDLNRNYTTQTAGVGYNYSLGKKLILSASLNYELALLGQNQGLYLPLSQQDPSLHFQSLKMFKQFGSLLPGFNITYNPNKTENITQTIALKANAYSILPSVAQLQDVLNITNPLNITNGNSSLEKGYRTTLELNYNLSNVKNSSSLTIWMRGSTVSNYIANHRRFFEKDTLINGTLINSGTQYTTPVNLNGYFNASTAISYSFRVKPLMSNLNISLYHSYTKTPSIENNVHFTSYSNNITPSIGLNSNISEKIDFSVRYNPTISFANSSNNRFDRYQQHRIEAMFNIFIVAGLYVNVDGNYVRSFGTQAAYDQSYTMLNGAVGYKFLRNRQADIKFAVYDALGQQQSRSQTVADSYLDIKNELILGRYFMLSFTYKFDSTKRKAN